MLADVLSVVPKSVQLVIAGGVLTGAVVTAAETRYMTVADYTKSYVLDLKAEIREIKKDLADPDLSPQVRAMLQEQLDSLLDELCYEVNDDPYCKDRD